MKTKKRVALFGGSFDPVHTDHVNIALACHEKLNFEEVWMIPAYLNPFKKKEHSPIVDRLAMLRIIEKKHHFIRINQYEIQNNRPTYTYETVAYLVENYHDFEFAFIMGSDQLDTFEKWNNFDKLINLVPFKVFLRSEKYNKDVVAKYNLEVFEFNNNFLSSTDIRDLKHLDKQIPQINDYVNYNLLYLSERMEKHMDHERFVHCLNVGQMAKKLAIKHGVDENKALVAGTLHDITKRWDKQKAEWYLKKYTPGLINEPLPVWHSFTGSLHLEKDWLIKDQEILQAVFNHTVGSPDMTPLDMIVFCADKISAERNYSEVEKLREICFEDLIKGFKLLVKNQYDVAIERHGKNSIGSMLQHTYDYWVKGVRE
ncbi:nicotinic acid mononucleotide adenylyltransferase [Williamsoniiplasma somnilux]|uniref:Probable nicotinate-nucleotide adenylyltransferase n=1 Tax=Williamsoniiplasma somnilux TaxID=215578 RepID=A0A2K8P1D2_9MOLU|nr:nicotinate-nucleotide adenylyltransferase [Williamsoniiplasma somnilux]ATZ18713.1 nicotinic acid mononucleotide adenylyltransferase [Williamsoniiplasma somnilux]